MSQVWVIVIIMALALGVAATAWVRELRRQAHIRAASKAERRQTDLSTEERSHCSTCRYIEQQFEVAENALLRHRELHRKMGEAEARRKQAAVSP
jgi:hypothetical protein